MFFSVLASERLGALSMGHPRQQAGEKPVWALHGQGLERVYLHLNLTEINEI